MEQKILKLKEDDIKRIESQRKWVRGHFTPESEHKYEILDEKLRLLNTIIESNWISKDETVKLQCLGITLGDCFIQKMNLKWIMVEDKYGIDPALNLEDTSIIIFPLTMISKRIEKNIEVDVYELFNETCKKIEELKNEGC